MLKLNVLTKTVPVLACLTSALVLTACDSRPTESATVQAASSQRTLAPQDASKPSGPITPATPANVDDTGIGAAEVRQGQTPPQNPEDRARINSKLHEKIDNVEQGPVDPASFIVKAEPSSLDLGEIPTFDSGKGTFKLVNTGTESMTIEQIKTSCGCTTTNVAPGTILAGGQSVDVEVRLSGGAVAHPLNKSLTVFVKGQPPMVVPVKAVSKSFVVMEPAELNPETMPEGKLVLKSVDGQPFKVTSMEPPVIQGLPTPEAKTEHELAMDWAKYRELGVARKTVFFFDHLKCPQLAINIKFKPEELAASQTVDRQKAADALAAARKNAGRDNKPATANPDAALVTMIERGQTSEVMAKLSDGLGVDHHVSLKGMTDAPVLSVACKMGKVELIGSLVAAGADIEAIDRNGKTPLMWAAESRNVEALRAMLKAGGSVSARDNLNGTALSWACGRGSPDCVKELIDAGSDIEVVGNVTGWTPLMWAAGFGDPASIPHLLAAKANIEAGDFLQGATPLVHAARTGQPAGVATLIQAGAKLDVKDRNGNTALLAAADTAGGTAEKIKLLIDAGADYHVKNNRGLNALQLSRKRTDARAADVVKLLEPLLAAETPSETPAQPAKAAAPAAAPTTVPVGSH